MLTAPMPVTFKRALALACEGLRDCSKNAFHKPRRESPCIAHVHGLSEITPTTTRTSSRGNWRSTLELSKVRRAACAWPLLFELSCFIGARNRRMDACCGDVADRLNNLNVDWLQKKRCRNRPDTLEVAQSQRLHVTMAVMHSARARTLPHIILWAAAVACGVASAATQAQQHENLTSDTGARSTGDLFSGLAALQQPRCRCLPGDPCWAKVDWASLNASVGGRLEVSVDPIAAACSESAESREGSGR